MAIYAHIRSLKEYIPISKKCFQCFQMEIALVNLKKNAFKKAIRKLFESKRVKLNGQPYEKRRKSMSKLIDILCHEWTTTSYYSGPRYINTCNIIEIKPIEIKCHSIRLYTRVRYWNGTNVEEIFTGESARDLMERINSKEK